MIIFTHLTPWAWWGDFWAINMLYTSLAYFLEPLNINNIRIDIFFIKKLYWSWYPLYAGDMVQHSGCGSAGGAYSKNEAINRVCWKTIALPFLPADCINDAFQELEASTDHALHALVTSHLQYVRRQWIDSTIRPPSSWSVCRQTVRTNNDVKGWHRRLNGRANRSNLNLYQLIQLLHTEAMLVQMDLCLMSEIGTSRHQRKSYTELHTQIHKNWDEFTAGTRSTSQLLSACSHECKNMYA